MKDIDFDELDRAVNSLINKPASDGNATNQPVPAGPVASTVVPVNVTNSVPVNTSASPVSSPVTQRSSGRFMDVVHPSSDMRPTPPAKVPSREDMTISPSKDLSSVAPTVAAPVEPVETSWPDPIDLHEASQKSQTSVESTQSAPPVQDSPFLTDAKVEKRPLGAFSDTPQPAGAQTPVPPVPDNNPADTPERANHPIETDTPLPAELQNDLLSIEDDDAHNSSAPVSITQQYTEEKSSTANQPTSAIFDTEAYRKPLAHPGKKKSGWMMVVWIFVLLVVGAGAGAAVYFYVLPLL